jgi:hypothetical protein
MPLRISLVVLMLWAAQGPAPVKVHCDSTRFGFGAGLLGMHSMALATMYWDTPAEFPNPSKLEERGGEFAVVCPSFSAEQDDDVFKIRGKDLKDVVRRIIEVQLLYWGEYRYPAIRQDYRANSTVAKIATALGQTTVTFDTTNMWRDSVIAVRINDGTLRPAVFEGKSSRIVIKTGERADFYVKAGPTDQPSVVKVARFTIDTTTPELRFWRVHAFPEK